MGIFKVKQLVEATEEYQKVKGTVNDLKSAIDKMENPKTQDACGVIEFNSCSFSGGGVLTLGGMTTRYETVSIYFDTYMLLRPALIRLMKEQLAELTKRMEGMEV